MGGGMMNGYGGFGYFGLLGVILNLVITIAVIVGIVVLVVWLVRRSGESAGNASRPVQNTGSEASPCEILQSRYARGELTREQYQEIWADLS